MIKRGITYKQILRGRRVLVVGLGKSGKAAAKALNEAGAEAYNALHQENGQSVTRYARGIVNPGESFVSFSYGTWTDWYDAIASFQSRGNNAYVSYDNLPIKAYVYPWSQVEKIHDLSNRVPAPGGEAAVCPEDGYTLLDIAG